MENPKDFELFAWKKSREREYMNLRVEKDKFEDVEDGQPLINHLHKETRNLNWWEGAYDELSQYRAAENFYLKHQNDPKIQRCKEPSAYIRFCVAKEIIKAETAAAGAAAAKPGGSRRKRAGTPSSTTSSGTASSSSTSQSGGGSSANRSDSFYSSAPSSSGGGSAGFGGGGGVGGGHIGNEAKRSKPMVVSPKTRR